MTRIQTNAVIWSTTNQNLINAIINQAGYLPVYLHHEKNNPVDTNAVAILTSLPQYIVGEGRDSIHIQNTKYIIIGYIRRNALNRDIIIKHINEHKNLLNFRFAQLYYNGEYYLKTKVDKKTRRVIKKKALDDKIKNSKKVKHFTQAEKPVNSKTYSQLINSKANPDDYTYAGTCSDKYGNTGHLFICNNPLAGLDI